MIHPAAPLASWFLLLAASFFLVLFAVPLLLFPLRWARWFLWAVPAGRNELCLYFGRCLGAVALAVTAAMLRAAPDPSRHAAMLELVVGIGGLMVGVHLWGALRRMQPWTETAEIALYALVTGIALWIRWTSA